MVSIVWFALQLVSFVKSCREWVGIFSFLLKCFTVSFFFSNQSVINTYPPNDGDSLNRFTLVVFLIEYLFHWHDDTSCFWWHLPFQRWQSHNPFHIPTHKLGSLIDFFLTLTALSKTEATKTRLIRIMLTLLSFSPLTLNTLLNCPFCSRTPSDRLWGRHILEHLLYPYYQWALPAILQNFFISLSEMVINDETSTSRSSALIVASDSAPQRTFQITAEGNVSISVTRSYPASSLSCICAPFQRLGPIPSTRFSSIHHRLKPRVSHHIIWLIPRFCQY